MGAGGNLLGSKPVRPTLSVGSLVFLHMPGRLPGASGWSSRHDAHVHSSLCRSISQPRTGYFGLCHSCVSSTPLFKLMSTAYGVIRVNTVHLLMLQSVSVPGWRLPVQGRWVAQSLSLD